MGKKVQITEYLDIDLEKELWCCNQCGYELISARENYKDGCLIDSRDPRTIYNSLVDAPYNFAHDPKWVGFVEFYCPNCGVMVECEMLPLGHPITHDIELDIDKLKQKYLKTE
ncbi:MAG: acetone carboxylase subunit gamma [Thermodesulfobacteriota bacterium]|nr:acetone carboxylase subunit gamma [Thermodesulfobacteriota bacterium]